MDRRTDRGAVDWAEKHQPYLMLWDAHHTKVCHPQDGPMHRHRSYMEYLTWFHSNARLRIRPAINEDYIADLPDEEDDEDIVDEYNEVTRQGTQPERAPFQNYTITCLVFCRYIQCIPVNLCIWALSIVGHSIITTG